MQIGVLVYRDSPLYHADWCSCIPCTHRCIMQIGLLLYRVLTVVSCRLAFLYTVYSPLYHADDWPSLISGTHRCIMQMIGLLLYRVLTVVSCRFSYIGYSPLYHTDDWPSFIPGSHPCEYHTDDWPSFIPGSHRCILQIGVLVYRVLTVVSYR